MNNNDKKERVFQLFNKRHKLEEKVKHNSEEIKALKKVFMLAATEKESNAMRNELERWIKAISLQKTELLNLSLSKIANSVGIDYGAAYKQQRLFNKSKSSL